MPCNAPAHAPAPPILHLRSNHPARSAGCRCTGRDPRAADPGGQVLRKCWEPLVLRLIELITSNAEMLQASRRARLLSGISWFFQLGLLCGRRLLSKRSGLLLGTCCRCGLLGKRRLRRNRSGRRLSNRSGYFGLLCRRRLRNERSGLLLGLGCRSGILSGKNQVHGPMLHVTEPRGTRKTAQVASRLLGLPPLIPRQELQHRRPRSGALQLHGHLDGWHRLPFAATTSAPPLGTLPTRQSPTLHSPLWSLASSRVGDARRPAGCRQGGRLPHR